MHSTGCVLTDLTAVTWLTTRSVHYIIWSISGKYLADGVIRSQEHVVVKNALIYMYMYLGLPKLQLSLSRLVYTREDYNYSLLWYILTTFQVEGFKFKFIPRVRLFICMPMSL